MSNDPAHPDDSDQSPDSDWSDTAAVEALLDELTTEDLDLVDPPADLWDRIRSEAARAGEYNAAETDAPEATRQELIADAKSDSVVAPVVSLESRRRTTAFIAAAAAAVIAVVGAAVVLNRGDASPQQLATAELAFDEAAFDPLGSGAAATAVLVDDDGALTVRIDDAKLPAADGADLEVWLIQPDADGNPADLISLGTIDPNDPADLVVPNTHDTDVFNVVDISVEPRDGDETHSGRSILRGVLTSA